MRTVIALILASARIVGAQPDTIRIAPSPACGACRIITTPLFTLGASSGAGELVGLPQPVTADARGRLWVLQHGHAPWVFDSTGRFIARVGRVGAGPGEYRSPRTVVSTPGDSVVVLDASTARATVLSPELRLARTVPLAVGPYSGAVLRWPDRVVLADAGGVNAVGARWQLADLRTSVVRSESFGPLRPRRRYEDPSTALQRLSATPTGGAWSLSEWRYELLEFERNGEVRRLVTGTPEWLPSERRGGLGSRTEPPPAALTAMWDGQDGLLWVVGRVPASTFPEAWPSGRGEVTVARVGYEYLFDSVIEVLDLRRGVLVARARVPGFVLSVLPGPRLVRYEVTEQGAVRLGVLGLRLEGW